MVVVDAAMVAVTAYQKRAVDWGIDPARIFAFDEGVGGRYSLWSAIGLPIALYLGFDAFRELLDGAREMDQHFRSAPLEEMGILRYSESSQPRKLSGMGQSGLV